MVVKAQVSIEHLGIFVFSLGIVLLSAFGTVVSMLRGPTALSTATPSSCYLTPQLSCIGMDAGSSTGNVTVMFSNGEGTSLFLPSNSFEVKMGASNTYYKGSCLAVSAYEGFATQNSTGNSTGGNDNGYGNNCHNNGNGNGNPSTSHCNQTNSTIASGYASGTNYSAPGTVIMCRAQVADLPSPGTQQQSVFDVGYRLCARRGFCDSELNTTGTATVYTSGT